MKTPKKSDTHSSKTLHSFFNKPSSTAASATFSPQRAVNTLGGVKSKSLPSLASEIIVIDSDSESESTTTSRQKEKRKADDCSSDIEIVDTVAAESPVRKIKGENVASPPSRDALHDDTQRSSVLDRLHSFPGTATRTSLQSIPSTSCSADIATSVHNLPSRASSARPSRPSLTPSSLPEQQKANASLESVDLTGDVIEPEEEWGTGDDELANANGIIPDVEEEEDENISVDSSESAEDLTLEACPLCGLKLRGFSQLRIQAHIDQCADKQKAGVELQDNDRVLQCRPPKSANAFSVLMSSHSENKAWKEADVAEDRNFRPTKGRRRKAPFYKVMTGMPIAVDAFRYGAIPGVTAYFLTHAHSDHYTNLSSSWKTGPIYCSEGTANLIIHMLSVERKWVHPLPMDTPILVPDTGGVTVTLIEANHCPGSSLFLFEGKQTVDAGDGTFKSAYVGSSRTFRYLHCGDFRASPQHVLHPAIKGKRLDTIYLDTTYLNPRYTFPSQSQVISACAELAKKLVDGESVALTGGETGVTHTMDKFLVAAKPEQGKPSAKISKTLVVVGTYSIGKERIVKEIARALGTKVYCDKRKAAILRCQQDPDLHAMLTRDPYSAGVHLVPLSVITSDRLKEYINRWKGQWDRAIGFRPTGWTYAPPAGADSLPSVASVIAKQPHRDFDYRHLQPTRNSTAAYQLFGVPYSEHSSFFELTCFSVSLDWARIIATVNVGSETSRGKMSAWVSRWEAERKRRGGGIVAYRSQEYW